MHSLLIALVKAYEIQGCYQMGNSFNAYGIDHVVLVKLASTAVVSWLLGLTKEQTMASISHVWMDGQPTRVYRSRGNTIPRKGWAASDASGRAVQLALYVRAGQPGAPEALSTKPWGFWSQTFGEQGFQFPRPFGTWTIRNVLFKTTPVEGHALSAVEAALIQLRRFHDRNMWDPVPQIKSIKLRTTAAADLIINKTGPLKNAADRDHCLQYVVALTLLKGTAPDVRDYLDTSPWTTSENLTRLRRKILVVPDNELTQDYLDLDKKSISNGLTVFLNDGSNFPEIAIEFPVGHVRHPETETAVEEKFLRSMAHMFSQAETVQILNEVHMDDMPVREFVDLLARPIANSRL
jgi:2-methylcitrate dehydratase